jgi:hypothetical protein
LSLSHSHSDRLKEQISLAISDALRSSISREVELTTTRMRGVIESVNEDIKREMTSTLQEVSRHRRQQ